VLSGGYKDDVAEGDSFIYSGAGDFFIYCGAGDRQVPEVGGRLTDAQTSDQTLDETNAALAITMFPGLDDPDLLDKQGPESSD